MNRRRLKHAESPELEGAIVANPDDVQAHAAYGRWLERCADPRAELIILQCEQRQGNDPKRGAARVRDLMQEQEEELRSLVPDCRVHVTWTHGFVREFDLAVPAEPSEEGRQRVCAVLEHPYMRLARKGTISIRCCQRTSDPAWILSALSGASLRLLGGLFVCGGTRIELQGIGEVFSRPAWVGTANHLSLFGTGPFPSIRILDLRDTHVGWGELPSRPQFPDLEVLVLRPRGSDLNWVGEILESVPPSMPRLRQVWALESKGDEILERLIHSPLLPQLRIVDFTDSLTNRGAKALHEHADRFSSVEQIIVGSTGRRRQEVVRFVRVGTPDYNPKPGKLEIDDGWRSRLRQRLGRRVSFDIRHGHPHLEGPS
jgi:uncharacterized protein (TIGR02996 family)